MKSILFQNQRATPVYPVVIAHGETGVEGGWWCPTMVNVPANLTHTHMLPVVSGHSVVSIPIPDTIPDDSTLLVEARPSPDFEVPPVAARSVVLPPSDSDNVVFLVHGSLPSKIVHMGVAAAAALLGVLVALLCAGKAWMSSAGTALKTKWQDRKKPVEEASAATEEEEEPAAVDENDVSIQIAPTTG